MRSVATHCRSWVGPDGAESLVDHRMMFGCRAAANWSQRGTGFLVWLVQTVMDQVQPETESARRAYELILLGEEDAVPRCAFVSQFTDGVPKICVSNTTAGAGGGMVLTGV